MFKLTVAFCLIGFFSGFVSPLDAQPGTEVQADDLNLNKKLTEITDSNILSDPDYYVWGGSVVQGEDQKFYMFYARWPKGYIGRSDEDQKLKRFGGMKGWLKYSEIAIAVSEKPNGPFKHLKTLLKPTFDESRWDRYAYHNPHIKKWNGRYYLYHTGVGRVPDKSYWYALNGGQRIGLCHADSIKQFIDGEFTQSKNPIIVPDGKKTFHRAVNPSVTVGGDGKYYMMWKASSQKSGRGRMVHWMSIADKPEGPWTLKGSALSSEAMHAEDPYLWYDVKRRRFYAIVKNYKKNGALGKQFGSLALITSQKGFGDWKPAKHKLVSLRQYMRDGKVVNLHNLERPQLLFGENGEPLCLYTATSVKNPSSQSLPFNTQTLLSQQPTHSECVPQNVFHDNWGVAPEKGAFRMKDYIIWGGSVIQGKDDRYYMFFRPGLMLMEEKAHAATY